MKDHTLLRDEVRSIVRGLSSEETPFKIHPEEVS
jgi:hypothetical protein